jgi:hypothetical protein
MSEQRKTFFASTQLGDEEASRGVLSLGARLLAPSSDATDVAPEPM